MSSFDFETCNIEPFVAEVTPQDGSLQSAASAAEIFTQQVEAYLQRLREAMCMDIETIETNCCNGGGGGGLPDLEAGVEVESGRTIDGSASYFMLVDLGAMPNATTKTVAHSIADTFRAVEINGAFRNPSTNDNRPLPYVSQSFATSQIAVIVDATNVNLITNANFSAFTQGYLVIEYIKV